MTSTSDFPECEKILSKNQFKKQLRRERWLEVRGEKRKQEKEKKKAKKRELAKERDEKSIIIPPRRYKLMKDSCNKFRVVIDMNFEDYMTESEIGKAAQQVARIYSLNRHSENPCQLYVTSLKGKIKDKFAITNAGYLNWDINLSEKGYTEVFREDTSEDGRIAKSVKGLIYLSGDSNESLPDVDSLLKDDSKIFIIGGLVDHNRHKNLCHKMAVEHNIPTAKLPIKEHITLCQRHILSTVTVFEIMLQVLGSHKQWPEALLAAIPKRKLTNPTNELEVYNKQQEVNQTDAESLNSLQQPQQQPNDDGGDDDGEAALV